MRTRATGRWAGAAGTGHELSLSWLSSEAGRYETRWLRWSQWAAWISLNSGCELNNSIRSSSTRFVWGQARIVS